MTALLTTINLFGALEDDAVPSRESLTGSLNLCSLGTYAGTFSGRVILNSPSTPVVFPIAPLTKVALFVLRSTASIKAFLTSGVGIDQSFPFSNFVWRSPISGDVLTGIKLQGIGDVDYLVAGA